LRFACSMLLLGIAEMCASDTLGVLALTNLGVQYVVHHLQPTAETSRSKWICEESVVVFAPG
jgi:hypothetical protein